MRPYSAYRDPDIEWLGEMPEHWGMKRLDQVATYRTSNVDKKRADGEAPVRLCNYTDVYYQDRIRAGTGKFMQATASSGEIDRFRLHVGDILITKDSEDWRDIAVPALVEETADDFVCGYHLGIVRAGALVEPAFLFRAMQSLAVNQQLQVSASGVTRYGLPNGAVGRVRIAVPPLAEQRDIAAFLDRETERIDSLIAKKRSLIERLQEYRTALITRTVTRGLPPEAARAAGLNPSPRLKPSGVEWLGDVPEHWEVGQLKRWFGIVNGGTPKSSEDAFWDGDIVWLTPDDLGRNLEEWITEGSRKLTLEGLESCSARLCPEGSIVVSTRAPIGHVAITSMTSATNQGCRTLVPGTGVDSEFAYFTVIAMKSILESLGQGSTFMELSQGDLSSVRLAKPPLAEQRVLVRFLNRETARVANLTSRTNVAMRHLQEYRTALITAAVTGKIDVRGTPSSGRGSAESRL